MAPSNVEKRFYDEENQRYVSPDEIRKVAATTKEDSEIESIGRRIMQESVNSKTEPMPVKANTAPLNKTSTMVSVSKWKYDEDRILKDLENFLGKSYDKHYNQNDDEIQCFDVWIALGDSAPTFRNTAMKYLYRYGKKEGNNREDLMKALHYIFMALHVEHYRNER